MDGPPDIGVVTRNVWISGIGYVESTLRLVGVSPRRLGVYPQARIAVRTPQLPLAGDLLHDRVWLLAAEDVLAVLVYAVALVDVGCVGAPPAVDGVFVTVPGVHRVIA